jgi:hypothetical protein
VVYSDPNVVDVACAGLNGLKMGDRTLTVRRAAEVRHEVARQHCTALAQVSSGSGICASSSGCTYAGPLAGC